MISKHAKPPRPIALTNRIALCVNQLPSIIEHWITVEGETETGMHDFILRSLEAYGAVSEKATTEDGWISFKLGCNLRQAKSAIAWAKK